MKRQIILFQKNLRKPVKQFGEFFKKLEFVHLHPQIQDATTYKNLPTFEKEIHRRKDGFINRIRRILGVPNIWPIFSRKGSLFFSYGYFLLTNKPYCIYIENGLALFAYDRHIRNNPIARTLVLFCIRRKNLKKLIFMSRTARKSFLATFQGNSSTQKLLEEKSTFCYPAIKTASNKEVKKTVAMPKFLFAGLFYMKGGVELVNAFSRITEKYPDAELTIITAKHIVKKEDREKIAALPGIHFIDAALTDKEMDTMYRTHDVFLLPTFRDSLGVVLIEALSFGMPLIINDHYATGELARDGWNGFVNPAHPMKDYNPETYEMYGRFFNPEDFYQKLFRLQKEGQTKPVEDFLFQSMEKFIRDPSLVETFSKHSLEHYGKHFEASHNAERMETILLEALQK